MAEIWDLVNEKGEPVGVKWCRKEHDTIPEGLYHPCVEVWVKVGQRLLITRRHPDKTHGLTYDVPGGAVLSGESFKDGAARELAEEAGISADKNKLIYLGAVARGKAYAVSFLLRLDEMPEITLQPTEVVGCLMVSKKEFMEMEDEICPPTLRRFSVYQKNIF